MLEGKQQYDMPTHSEALHRFHDAMMKRKLAGTLTPEDAALLEQAEEYEADGLVKPYEPPTKTPVPGAEPPGQE